MFSASHICHYWRSVLISSPFLWTSITCRCVPRTLVSLGRSKSLPIQLRLESAFSTAALEAALLHESRISSLVTIYRSRQVSLLRQLFTHSRQSLEQLHICSETGYGWAEEAPAHGIWDHLPSVRELLVSRHLVQIEKLNAPNLIHLALEGTGHRRTVTVPAILDVLCECPLLETLLLSNSGIPPEDASSDQSSVCLPRLRSIELGEDEVRSGLITSLQFSRNIAAGFRVLTSERIYTDDFRATPNPIQHILGRIDSRCITLAASPGHLHREIFIRFEGPGGSLEITTYGKYSAQPHVLLALERMLFFPLPGIENVTELHIIGCSFDRSQMFPRINATMKNIVCISFFNCDESQVYRLLTRTHDSLPPFPHLERIMVFGHESKLEHMARRRRELGVPIKTLVLGRKCRGFQFTRLKDYTDLRELVGHLWAGCPTEIVGWGTGNDILQIWSPTKVPVSPGRKR